MDLDPFWADALHLFEVKPPEPRLLMLFIAALIAHLITLVAKLIPQRWRRILLFANAGTWAFDIQAREGRYEQIFNR